MAVPLSTKFAPIHIKFGTAVAVTPDGTVLIVTIAVVAVVVPQVLVAARVYTPALPAATPVTPALIDVLPVMEVPPGLVHK